MKQQLWRSVSVGVACAALGLGLPASAQQTGQGAGGAPATSSDSVAKAKKTPQDASTPTRREYFRQGGLALDDHPIGATLPLHQLRFSGFLPMQPAGFRATQFGFHIEPVYGVGSGWEVTAGGLEAEREGPGGEAIFYGAGIQKQFIYETNSRPAVSIAGYGMVGPHDHHSGSIYLAASKRILGRPRHGISVYLHGGGKLETFGGRDYGADTGIRPYVGLTSGIGKRFFLSTEFSPPQPWQRASMFTIRGTVVIWHGIGVTGGIGSTGYKTLPFIGVAL